MLVQCSASLSKMLSLLSVSVMKSMLKKPRLLQLPPPLLLLLLLRLLLLLLHFFFHHTSNTTVTMSATYSLLLLLLLLYSFYSSCSCSSSSYYYYCHEGNCQMYMHYCLHCCSELSASTTYAKCAPPFMNSSNTKSELNQISYFTLDVDEMNGVFYLRNDRRGVQNYMVSGLLPTKLERDRNLSRTL